MTHCFSYKCIPMYIWFLFVANKLNKLDLIVCRADEKENRCEELDFRV